ncbi:MAG TPA: DUF2520 domain-containing protein [Thermoanaerobaculia bacterium]
MKTSVLLFGPGRAGRAFARSWTSAGGSIVIVARKPGKARAFVRSCRGVKVVALRAISRLAADVVVISVPDDAIASLAARLARRITCRFAFHFSGALGSLELAPFSSGGTSLGSLHPLRAFSGSPEDDWNGAFVAVEGDETAARMGFRLCHAIGARPRRLPASGKPLYHAAATLAAAGSASLLSFAARLWAEAGLDQEEGRVALAALATSAIDAVSRLPFERAVTGPVARRDIETVRLHREVLAPKPEVARLYALLAAETLRRTPGAGRGEEIAGLLGLEESDGPSFPRRVAKESGNRRRKG